MMRHTSTDECERRCKRTLGPFLCSTVGFLCSNNGDTSKNICSEMQKRQIHVNFGQKTESCDL